MDRQKPSPSAFVFYSWQSDLANNCNRTVIEKALKQAITEISRNELVAIEPVLDRDTLGLGGSPDIAATIFKKIDQARIFVGDISIINQGSDSRPCPNPNVLVEVGYALSKLGGDKVILVFNTSSGSVADLPFDLRQRRIMTYNLSTGSHDSVAERRKLGHRLKRALEIIIFTEVPCEDAFISQILIDFIDVVGSTIVTCMGDRNMASSFKAARDRLRRPNRCIRKWFESLHQAASSASR